MNDIPPVSENSQTLDADTSNFEEDSVQNSVQNITRHFALGISYDGTGFRGWQRQNDVASVQGEIESALSRIADEPVLILGAGRTDAGVHATGQVASFSCNKNRPLSAWLRGLNGLTNDAVRIDWVQAVPEGFHPRFNATSRSYVYIYHDPIQKYADPLLNGRVWSVQGLDADRMHRSARALLGEHDFSGFRAAGCQSLTPVRRIDRCDVLRFGDLVVVDIEANAFLLHMVRNIARVLADVGQGARETLPEHILKGGDRRVLGATAPADGLYLRSVSYAEQKFPEPHYPALINGAFKQVTQALD